jgi:hypothetical protein
LTDILAEVVEVLVLLLQMQQRNKVVLVVLD